MIQVTKIPVCGYCGDEAPFGDLRNYWIGYHTAWYHQLWWSFKKKWVKS